MSVPSRITPPDERAEPIMSKQPDDVSPKADGKSGSFGYGTVVRGVRRHPFWALLVVMASVTVMAGIWLFLPLPKLTAYAVYQISAESQALFTPVGDAKADFNFYRQGQAAMVKSRPVLNAAFNERLGEA